jgi:hypothetical protein
MNPDIQHNDNERDEFESLESQLRAMPRDQAPAGLLEQLLVDIPQLERPLPRRQPVRWLLPMSAIAAAVCIVSMITVFERRPAVRSEFDVSVNLVVFRPQLQQETDPCCILPPLPDSLRL